MEWNLTGAGVPPSVASVGKGARHGGGGRDGLVRAAGALGIDDEDDGRRQDGGEDDDDLGGLHDDDVLLSIFVWIE